MKLTAELIGIATQRMRRLRSLGEFTASDRIRAWLIDKGVKIEMERDGSIFWWSKYKKMRGVAREKPLETEKQRWAQDQLLVRTYEFRRPMPLGKATIRGKHTLDGDLTYLPKDKLVDIFLGEETNEENCI